MSYHGTLRNNFKNIENVHMGSNIPGFAEADDFHVSNKMRTSITNHMLFEMLFFCVYIIRLLIVVLYTYPIVIVLFMQNTVQEVFFV
jgi:hypothetical protein